MKTAKEYKIVNCKGQNSYEELINSCLTDGWKILKLETVPVRSANGYDVVHFIAHFIRNRKLG